jgi:hypothetical protein
MCGHAAPSAPQSARQGKSGSRQERKNQAFPVGLDKGDYVHSLAPGKQLIGISAGAGAGSSECSVSQGLGHCGSDVGYGAAELLSPRPVVLRVRVLLEVVLKSP